MNAGKARVAVLFSGGIDSTVIAYLAHRCVSFYDLSNATYVLQAYTVRPAHRPS
jgi:asparagine synthetase B (glutamine-hydrolysing)